MAIILLWTTAAAGVVVAFAALGWNPSRFGGDAWNYLAAGERLNAGHDLYALGPGDRPVPIVPPYWTVPLLAPPPIGVAWRPVAMLGDVAMLAWAVAAMAAVAVSTWAMRGAVVAVAVLALPVALTALSGNVSAFVLAAFILIWGFRDRPAVVGSLIAATAAVKLTPLALVVWLVVTRRWRALVVTVVVGAAIVLASIAGAGIDAWAAWARSVPFSGPSPLALATLTGLPTWSIAVLAVLAVLGVWGLTRSDRATFAVAVVGSALATPALYFQALGLLLAAAAPWVIDGPSDRWWVGGYLRRRGEDGAPLQ